MKIQFVAPQVQKNLIVFFDEKKRLLLPKDWPQELSRQWQAFLGLPEVKAESSSVHNLFHPLVERVFLVGLGKKRDFRELGGMLGKKLVQPDFSNLHLLLPEAPSHPIYNEIEPFLEGLFLGRYRYQGFKAKDNLPDPLSNLTFLAPKTKALAEAASLAWTKALATNQARDLGNLPGNKMRPKDLMAACKAAAKQGGLTFSALNETQMEKEGMGCLLGVAQGSEEPAFLNILEYKAGPKAPTLLLVGKGLTFDSGGISLKPGLGMQEMKHDMCGGAAVLGAMQIIAQLRPKVNVVALIPTTENMPDGKATKPGDVLTACNGTTVEVLNTDAEGRLILADALAYGIKRFKPSAVVDVATLTGACVVALGHYHSGLMCNDEKLYQQVEQAAKRTGDPVWRMPHAEVYDKEIEGTLSDLKNIGSKDGGMITAGMFLKRFVGEVPWAHLDIAGTAWSVERIPYYPTQGATGTVTRLLADLAMNWKK